MMGDSGKMSDELSFYFVLCGEDHGIGTEKIQASAVCLRHFIPTNGASQVA